MDITTLFYLILIGVLAGVLSGFVGVGGGIIIVPALIYILKMSPVEAQGTSIALMLPPIGILAFMQYYKAGNINLTYSAIIAVVFTASAFFGARYAQKLDQNLIKLIFGGVMIIAAVKLIADGWKYFGDKT